MSEAHPPALDISQAFGAFMRQRGIELTDLQSNLVYAAIKEVLGDELSDAYLTLELAAVVWTLIVVGDDLRLVRLKDDDTTEIRFLGRLRGSYFEEVTLVPMADGRFGFKVDLRFDVADQRFPGDRIDLELVPTPQSGFVTDLEAQREEMIRDHLRPWLRMCADETPPDKARRP